MTKCKHCGRPILLLNTSEKHGFYIADKPKPRETIVYEHICEATKTKEILSQYMIERLHLDSEGEIEES